MAGLSNYLENKLIEHTLRGIGYTPPAAVYVALYTDDPTDNDTGTELSGGGYARKLVTFGTATDGTVTTNADVIFAAATADWTAVTHVGIRDAATGGSLLFYGELSSSVTVVAGDNFRIAAGNLTCALQ